MGSGNYNGKKGHGFSQKKMNIIASARIANDIRSLRPIQDILHAIGDYS